MDDPAKPDFVPALGRAEFTNSYDKVIAVMTRERCWRAQLLSLVAPAPGEAILDVGCGTGTFAVMLKTACPTARVTGIDPDEEVLDIARLKAAAAGVEIVWQRVMGDRLASLIPDGSADKAVTSLVLHQCPLDMKSAILGAMHAALKHGGRLFIADYGEQRTLLMRLLFRQGAAARRLREHPAQCGWRVARPDQASRLCRRHRRSQPAHADRRDRAHHGR